MNTTKYDDYLHLKLSLEKLFGTTAWTELKDYSTLQQWKKWITKSLRALSICANETIQIADASWKKEYSELIDEALERASSSKTIDDLVSGFAGDMLKISFLQLGLIPNRRMQKTVSLKPENWKLDVFRSVQYVQSNEQMDREFLSQLGRKLGSQVANDLFIEFKKSKCNSFKTWYEAESKIL